MLTTSRMQCETVSGGPHGNALIAEVFKKMQKQGYRAFYRGLNLGLIGMFPYSAIDLGTFGSYSSAFFQPLPPRML